MSRRYADPFPPDFLGLQPTQGIRWEELASKLVHEILKIEPHERIILSADAYFGGSMLDAVRVELQRARAIELTTILHWTPSVAAFRAADGSKIDPEDARIEDVAMRDLFGIADVFMWLQSDCRHPYRTHAQGQSEWILETWKGRGIHFHWFHDPMNTDPHSPANKALDLVYQSAVLDLDYVLLGKKMQALSERLTDAEVNVTNPAGTDISFRTQSRIYLNDGDASREKAARANSARDREEEVPCGALRTVPDIDSVEGIISFTGNFGFPAAGYGLDVNKWFDQGLRFIFEKGRVVRVETDGDQPALDREWAAQTGDKDKLGEFVLGCNPLLKPVPGSSFQPYFGFGDGIVRLTLGENIESGGSNVSSVHRWLMLIDSNVKADGHQIVRDGRLVPEYLAL